MIDEGLYDTERHAVPIPDICLGQHVFPMLAGTVETKTGTVMSAANSFKITIYGRGGHGSSPHLSRSHSILHCSETPDGCLKRGINCDSSSFYAVT